MSQSPKPGSPDSAKGKGKRRASSDRPPNQQIDFEFLNFSHPSEAKASRARRTVRSHVTRQQHQREQLAAAAARRSRSQPQPIETDEPQNPPPLRTAHTIATSTAESPAFDRQQHSPIKTSRSDPTSVETSTTASPVHSPSEYRPAQLDPFEIYPPEWHASIPAIIDHYLANLATEDPGLDGNRRQRALQHVWFPFVLTDATLFHSVMLLAASAYTAEHGPDSHPIDTITLRGMAIRGINQSLHDPAKSTGDELVGAVLSVAAYEAIYGDIEAYAMHMVGLRQVVQLKGGLSALGLDGLLERMLLWVDSNASRITGYDVFFPKSHFPSESSHPYPDSHAFSIRRPAHERSS